MLGIFRRMRDRWGRVLRGAEIDWHLWQLERRWPLPPESYFTPVNQGGATYTRHDDKSVTLTAPASASTSLRLWTRAVPATPWTVTAKIRANFLNVNGQFGGLFFYETSSGKVHTLDFAHGRLWYVHRWTDTATFAAYDAEAVDLNIPLCPWIQINDDGTDRTFKVSANGILWRTLATVTRTTHLTPSHWGIHVNEQSNGSSALLSFESLNTTQG